MRSNQRQQISFATILTPQKKFLDIHHTSHKVSADVLPINVAFIVYCPSLFVNEFLESIHYF